MSSASDDLKGLRFVPDTFSEEDHQAMDDDVRVSVGTKNIDNDPKLLCTIVFYCDKLSTDYTRAEACERLIDRYPQITLALQEARTIKNTFKYIRLLEVLQRSSDISNVPDPKTTINPRPLNDRENEAKATKKAWKTPFVGKAHELLHRCIDEMNGERLADAYRNSMAIIQSSGTGKSRTVDEVARNIFTLPFCLRKASEFTAYPPPDDAVRTFFGVRRSGDQATEDHNQYKCRLHLFFEQVFTSANRWIEDRTKDASENYSTLAESWRTYLESGERKIVYETAVKIAEAQYRNGVDLENAIQRCNNAAHHLLTLLKSRRPIGKHDPPRPVQLLMYFDEAHDMTEDSCLEYIDNSQVRTLRTAHMALLQALNDLIVHDIFAVFMSTNSVLSKFAPSRQYFFSERGRAANVNLQPPFVELPFDQWEENYMVREGIHTLEEICKPGFMVRFGRPLFWSWWKNASTTVKQGLIEFAVSKLYGAVNIEESKINLTEKAMRYEQDLVAGHMRIALSIPGHREYMRSGTPSEPILAEAAARVMKTMYLGRSTPLKVLNIFVKDDLISKGERGELVARLLLTLAHDSAIRSTPSHTMYSQPIPLTDFLTSLISEKFIHNVLGCHADNISGGPSLAEAFKDARVHFTHFGKADSPKMLSDEAAWIAMSRGMAWQFYNQQYAADIGIPILLWNERLGRYMMSILVVQVKNHKRGINPPRIDLEDPKCAFFTEHPTEEKYNTRPYISLTLQLGVQPGPNKSGNRPRTPTDRSTTLPDTPSKLATSRQSERESIPRAAKGKAKEVAKAQHPRYCIDIYGCSSTVFNVIGESEKDDYALLLASRDLLDEHPRRDEVFLNAIRDFKSTWESSDATFRWCEISQPSRLVEDNKTKPYRLDEVIVS